VTGVGSITANSGRLAIHSTIAAGVVGTLAAGKVAHVGKSENTDGVIFRVDADEIGGAGIYPRQVATRWHEQEVARQILVVGPPRLRYLIRQG